MAGLHARRRSRPPRLPLSSGLDPRRLAEITAEPRRYGFHGTLKPPMALIDDVSETDFLAAVGRFAASQRTFNTPPLALAELSDFLALVPTGRSPELQDLADHCVIEFDEFRRPAGEEELARRRAAGLSPRQDELLLRWGYPYVLEEWRFHLTLTGRLAGCGRADGGDERPAPAVFASGRPPAAGARSLRLPPGRARPGVHRAGALQARRWTADEG